MLLRPHRPALVSSVEAEPGSPTRASEESHPKSPAMILLDATPTHSADPVWAQVISAIHGPPPWFIREGGKALLEPGRRWAGPWDGESWERRGLYGVLVEARPGGDAQIEAERVRRLVSSAPRRLMEAGWNRSPSVAVMGWPLALRALPRGLADLALIQAEDLKDEDFQIARRLVVLVASRPESRPRWAGLTVAVGPAVLWWAEWLEDPRLKDWRASS